MQEACQQIQLFQGWWWWLWWWWLAFVRSLRLKGVAKAHTRKRQETDRKPLILKKPRTVDFLLISCRLCCLQDSPSKGFWNEHLTDPHGGVFKVKPSGSFGNPRVVLKKTLYGSFRGPRNPEEREGRMTGNKQEIDRKPNIFKKPCPVDFLSFICLPKAPEGAPR